MRKSRCLFLKMLHLVIAQQERWHRVYKRGMPNVKHSGLKKVLKETQAQFQQWHVTEPTFSMKRVKLMPWRLDHTLVNGVQLTKRGRSTATQYIHGPPGGQNIVRIDNQRSRYFVMHATDAQAKVDRDLADLIVKLTVHHHDHSLEALWRQHGLIVDEYPNWPRITEVYVHHVVVATGTFATEFCRRWKLSTDYWGQVCLNCKWFNLHGQCEHYIAVRSILKIPGVDLTKWSKKRKKGRKSRTFTPDALRNSLSALEEQRAKRRRLQLSCIRVPYFHGKLVACKNYIHFVEQPPRIIPV